MENQEQQPDILEQAFGVSQSQFVERFRQGWQWFVAYHQAEREGFEKAQLDLEKVDPKEFGQEARNMAYRALRQITYRSLMAPSDKKEQQAKRERALRNTFKAIGALTGVADSLEKKGQSLVWRSRLHQDTLEHEWSLAVCQAGTKLTGDEAVITPDRAAELSTMLLLNRGKLVVDLHEWFCIGVVSWRGKRVWQEGQEEPPLTAINEPGVFALNRWTKFEPRLIPYVDFEDRIKEITERESQKLKDHLGHKRANQVQKHIQRQKEEILERLKTSCFPRGEDVVESDQPVSKRIYKASRAELRRELEKSSRDLASQEKRPDVLARLWLNECLAKGLGLKMVIDEKGSLRVIREKSRSFKSAEQTRFKNDLCKVLAVRARRRRKKKETEDRAREEAEAREEEEQIFAKWGWDKLLELARQTKVKPDNPHLNEVFTYPLRGKLREEFEKGVMALSDELLKFARLAVETVAQSADDFNQDTLLTAFYLRMKALAALRPSVAEQKIGHGRNFCNGLWSAAQVLAHEAKMNTAEIDFGGEYAYSAGKRFIAEKVRGFGSDGRSPEEGVVSALDLLEKMYMEK